MKRFGVLIFFIGASVIAESDLRSFNLQTIQSLLSNRRLGIQRMDQLLHYLPPSLKSQYVLMERSQAEHQEEVSREKPRAILFNKDASLLLAFTTDPNRPGYETLQAIQKRPNGSYDFREITFPADVGKSGSPSVSETKTTQCMGCHTSNLRPNWEPYPFWPGAIGAHGDGINLDIPAKNYLTKLIESGKKDPRLAKLDRRKNLSLVKDKILTSTMAFDLHNLLDQQQQERIAGFLTKSPDFARYKYALAGAIAACPNFEQMVPEEIQGKLLHPKQYYLEDTERHLDTVNGEHKKLIDDLEKDAVANLRWLIEGRNVSTDGWAFSFQNPYLFSAVGSVEFKEILESLGRRDPGLKRIERIPGFPTVAISARFGAPYVYRKLFAKKYDPVIKRYCDLLLQASTKAFGSFQMLRDRLKSSGFVQAVSGGDPNLLTKDHRLYYMDANGIAQPFFREKDGTVHFATVGRKLVSVQAAVDAYHAAKKALSAAEKVALTLRKDVKIPVSGDAIIFRLPQSMSVCKVSLLNPLPRTRLLDAFEFTIFQKPISDEPSSRPKEGREIRMRIDGSEIGDELICFLSANEKNQDPVAAPLDIVQNLMRQFVEAIPANGNPKAAVTRWIDNPSVVQERTRSGKPVGHGG